MIALLRGGRCVITRSVRFLVLLEPVAFNEALLADVAFVRPLAGMCTLMNDQRTAVRESSIAGLASVGPVT